MSSASHRRASRRCNAPRALFFASEVEEIDGMLNIVWQDTVVPEQQLSQLQTAGDGVLIGATVVERAWWQRRQRRGGHVRFVWTRTVMNCENLVADIECMRGLFDVHLLLNMLYALISEDPQSLTAVNTATRLEAMLA